jgi:hypothetical protein
VNTINTNTTVMDRKTVLSTLWIFAMLNYLYADVFTLFFNPAAQGAASSMPAGAVLAFAALMETAIAMVLLSRVLKYGVNRWVNIAAGVIHTALAGWATFGEAAPAPHAVLFAANEVACTLFIIWYAWTWRSTEAQS